MRRFVLTCAAAAAIVMTGALPQARAMTLPAGLGMAMPRSNLAEPVGYRCHRAWHCGFHGCGWRRACFWSPGRHHAHGHHWSHRKAWRHRHHRR